VKRLLWTGGWDSSFRTLHLTLNQGEIVQPYYVIDPDRPGNVYELRAIAAISNGISTRGGKVLPLIARDKASLMPDAQITSTMVALRGDDNVGLQYDFLARLAKEIGEPLELSIHKDDKAHAILEGRLVNGIASDPVFKHFRFPLFDLTKLQMRELAQQSGFLVLLMLSWFCHKPIRGGTCGICSPCNYTREEGLGYRISLQGRIREKLYSSFRRIRALAQ
jgi:hypothetical protein